MACDLKFVKAPNGKKSKMFDALNEEFGQNQALKTWVATKTPVFEKEFGKSKVVDSNGEPLLMYRGEKQGIEKFTYKGHRTPSKLGRGIYFTSNKDYAKGFGTVYPVFINSENVKVYENKLAFLKDVADHYDIKTVPNRNQQLSYVDNLHSKGIDVAFKGFTELNIHSDTQYKIAVDMNSEKDIMHPIRKEAAEERLLDLEKRLISFLSPFGITVEAYASLKEKTGYDAAGMANITKKLILISQDKAKVDTLPEEVGHFIYELLGEENPLVKRMRDLAVKTDLYAEVKENPENIKAYGTDESRYIAETVGKLIGRALVSNFQTDAQPKTMLNTIKRIWERIKKFFQKADLKKLQREVEEVYGSLASNILQGDATGLSVENMRDGFYLQTDDSAEQPAAPVGEITDEQVHKAAEEAGMVWDSEEEGSKEFMDLSEKITGVRHIEKMGNEQRSKLIDAIKKIKPSTISEDDKVVDKTLTKIEDLIIDAKNSIQARIDQLIKTADEGDVKAKNIRKNLEYLITLLDSEDKKFALINFLKKAQKDMFIVRKKFREMKESGEVSARDMLRYSRYVEAYNKGFINGILDEISESEEFELLIPKEKQEAFRNSFGRLRDDIEADFFELGKPLLAKVLSKLNANTDISEGDILAELSKSTKDIATWQRWIETLAESPDTIIALAAKMVNEQKEAARLATIEFNHELLDKIDEFEKFRGREASKDPKALYDIFYAKDEDGKLIGRLLKYDEALEKLGKDSKEFEFYEYFTQTYYKLQKKLPWQFNKGLWLPSLRETDKEKIASGKSVVAAVKETLSDLLTWQVDDVGFGSESGRGAKSAHKFVPVLYHSPIGPKPGQLSPDLVSYDLGNSLQAFGSMAINNSHMNTIVSELEVLKEILAVREVTKTSGKDPVPDKSKKHGTAEQRALTDLGASSNVYAQFSMYLDQVMYGERKSSDEIELPWGGKIPKTKLADALNKYSSLRALGFNLFSGISNLTMGKTMNFVEAHAGQWFTKKDFLWAQKEYLIGMSGFLSDLRKKRNRSFYGQVVELFDGLQEYDEYGNRVTGNRLWKRLISTSSIFFLQKGGEHEIQVSLLIAFLKGQKIKTKSGEEISLIDAFEQKNGELVVKDNVEYTKEQLIKDSQKFKQVSQKLHGIYNQQDLINMQHVWAGRLGILFRKWLYPSFKRRWGGTRFNQRLESYEEGNYITVKNFLRDVYRNMKALDVTLIGSYHATKGAMPEWQKQNMRRTKMELMITLSLIALIAFISGLDDEDEERNWIENMTLFQLHRLYGEMSMYWNPKEALKILKSPAASMSAVENVFRLISGIAGVAGGLIFEGEIPKYERDSGLYEEGDWKVLKPFEELWPLWKEIRAVQAPENRLKWMEWK